MLVEIVRIVRKESSLPWSLSGLGQITPLMQCFIGIV